MYKWLVIGWCSIMVQRHNSTIVQRCKGAKAQKYKILYSTTQPYGMVPLDLKAWHFLTIWYGTSQKSSAVLYNGVALCNGVGVPTST